MGSAEESLMDCLRDVSGIQTDSGARQLYFDLLCQDNDESALSRSRRYLTRQLKTAEHYSSDLPTDPDGLVLWMESNTARVGSQYRLYLEARKAGGSRRYFTSKSHALYFLKSVAPTKLVDGAWLYGLVNRWRDIRFRALIHIYLEELGEGIPDKNHVVIYKKLLAAHGCDQWRALHDANFVQGAIQLALAHNAAHFLPEVIGFNLGYEQLPLHLLICAYELNELGIDPYYFTLHVTVDNASSGHATKAVQGLVDALPRIANKGGFYRRVVNGYKLNSLGASTNSVIADFDLDKELLTMLAAKCAVGAQLHSDYCRVGGKSINEWLADPAQLPGFLDSLQELGWIKRHQDPEHSRFWKLINGEGAQMFGVFNAYERQVIHDWIAGDSAAGSASRHLSYKAKQRLLDTLESNTCASREDAVTQGAAHEHYSADNHAADRPDDFNMELRLLHAKLECQSNKDALMALLTPLMSPAHHHTAAGLMATRVFTRLLEHA